MTHNTDTPNQVHQELVDYIFSHTTTAKLYDHPASKTSEESMQARHAASGERVTGAKALLVKLDIKEKSDVFTVIVLPGFNKLDSKVLKTELRERIPGLRNFRFARPEEMAHVAKGIQPGKMPPIGRPIFPNIQYTFIDESLLNHERIGFNAADFEKSIIIPTSDLLAIVPNDGVFPCSIEE